MYSSTNAKNNPSPSYSDSRNSEDDSYDGNQWQENSQDYRRYHPKSRDRGQDGEWNRERSFLAERENLRDYDSKINREKQLTSAQPMEQTASFPAYNYNAVDPSYLDDSRRTLSKMSAYNMIASMNTPWNVNPMSISQNNMPMNQNPSWMPVTAGMGIVQATGTGVNSHAFMTMPVENMYGVVGMGNYCQYGAMPAQENMFFPTLKEIVHLTNCVLYPPNPNAPRPTTREKPLGCKTVFVGGLPEKATEEIIKEIFERCCTVETIRMSKKKFCHIRFSNELFVENAIYFSGYRLKIENKDEAPYSGRLHVDYAQAQDDQYDYECKQRALQRQARQQEQDNHRSITPPIVAYTDHEASLICEKLKKEDSFSEAASIVKSWCKRGELTKKNACSFFSMVQSTYHYARKLELDKVKYEKQLNEAKKMLKLQMERIIRQFTESGEIYKAASLQKCWDHFSKYQRKNIEMWKKETEKVKNAYVEEIINEREDGEMEFSDDENDDNKKSLDIEQLKSQHKQDVHKLREEADSLKCQLAAAQNEIMFKQSVHDEIQQKDNELAVLRQALQNSSEALLNMSQKLSKDETELKQLCAYKCNKGENDRNEENALCSSSINLKNEAHLISLISTFLLIHPFGATIDYIWTYLHQIDFTIKARDVENLLKKFPAIYKEVSVGIDASVRKMWYYTGFQR